MAGTMETSVMVTKSIVWVGTAYLLPEGLEKVGLVLVPTTGCYPQNTHIEHLIPSSGAACQ